MRRHNRNRVVRFEVRRGRLVRHVELPDGRAYTHFCSRDVLEQVALVVEQRGEAGVTTNELWTSLPDLPCTQISVALQFLKDRGCVTHEGRRSYAASGAVVEDALAEYHVLAGASE